MSFPKKYKPSQTEARIRQFWSESGIYRFDPLSQKPCFSIDTPPPYVSADHLHVGHAMSYSQAEFIVRFKRMRGYNIFYPMGFDDNGLPTERFVEKKYGITSDNDREKFLELCLLETARGSKTYRKLWDTLGISVDWSLSYSTIDQHSQKTAQLSFLDLIEKGLIERRAEPMLWCCQCKTSLAQADIEIEKQNTFLYDIVFGKNLTISTTRPEMLAACVALYAHPQDRRYQHFFGKTARVPLFDYQIPIRSHHSVEPEYGSGLMMVCTWGDAEDVAKWREDRLPTRHILAADGRLNSLAGGFAGLTAKEARSKIIQALQESNRLAAKREISHNLGTHERCATPIEFGLAPQWFVRILEHKQRFLELSQQLNWFPKFMKIRLDDWIEGLKWDWCISRQRAYGVPFPVWYCNRCAKPWYAEKQDLPIDPRLSSPAKAKCSCGSKKFTGERDVMDTWMTSSLTPLINSHWANDNKYAQIYPQTIRVQVFEIIRTWLFYTMIKGEFHTGKLPWKDIMISGWGLDSQGKKMSKRLGNFVEPETIIEKYSADALRYWSAQSSLGHDLRYQESEIATGQKLLTKLWNASRFIYGHLFDEQNHLYPRETGKPTAADLWICARFTQTSQKASAFLENYDYSHALKEIERFFFSDFCDNYLEIIKPRFWKSEIIDERQIKAARMILYDILSGILKLFAPFIPFITEEIYQLIYANGSKDSIHICPWPETKYLQTEEIIVNGRKLLDSLSVIRKWKSRHHLSAGASLAKITIFSPKSEKERAQQILPDLRTGARAKIGEIIDGPSWEIICTNDKI